MLGIALLISPLVLWSMLHSTWLAQGPRASKLAISLLALGVTLFLQSTWFALVIESWQFWVAPQWGQPDLSPTILLINWLLTFGRKSGWLLVGLTALIILFRGWRLYASGPALLRAAFNISLFTLVGVLLEMLVLPLCVGGFVVAMTLLSNREPPWLGIQVVRFALCLLLVGALYWRLWQGGQTEPITSNAVWKPGERAT